MASEILYGIGDQFIPETYIDRPYARRQILYMRGYSKPTSYDIKYQIIYDKIISLKENLDRALEGGQNNLNRQGMNLGVLCTGKLRF